MYKKISNQLQRLRPLTKPFLVALIIYSIPLLAIMRANYSYMDDLGRSVQGYAWLTDFNRYSSSVLGFILNTNKQLTDISPLPQLVSIVMLSSLSLIAAYMYGDRKIRYPVLIASCFMGLTPFMLGCWVFKFDAPCMAMSLLASVIPLLMWDKLNTCTTKQRIAYWLVTVICCLIMWTSYQASGGVMPVMMLGVAFLDTVKGKSIKLALKKLLLYITGYLTAALIFKLALPSSSGVSYREVNMFNFSQLVPGSIANVKTIISEVVWSMNKYWILAVVCLLGCFILTVAISWRRQQRSLLWGGAFNSYSFSGGYTTSIMRGLSNSK